MKAAPSTPSRDQLLSCLLPKGWTPGTLGSEVGMERAAGGREWAESREKEWEGSSGQGAGSRQGAATGQDGNGQGEVREWAGSRGNRQGTGRGQGEQTGNGQGAGRE